MEDTVFSLPLHQIKVMQICSMALFCGSRFGEDPVFKLHAAEICEILAKQKVTVVYGGADRGLMQTVANSTLEHKGKVIGVIPQILKDIELQHDGLTELHITENMHHRKMLLFEKCDAAVVLPGGFGTLDEMFEMLTWNQLEIHDKPLFLMNTNGFYNHLIAHIHHLYASGFLYHSPWEKIKVLNQPQELRTYL
jgi:uncharacterized protein (TIGR00730 family)